MSLFSSLEFNLLKEQDSVILIFPLIPVAWGTKGTQSIFLTD